VLFTTPLINIYFNNSSLNTNINQKNIKIYYIYMVGIKLAEVK